jgi:hypothetical protein
MTLDQLKAKFTGLLNRRDLTANTALVSDFIDQALMRVQRELRVPALEKSALVTVDSTYATNGGLLIPGDCIELIDIIPIESLRSILPCSITKAMRLALTFDCPENFCRQGVVWVLGPTPNIGDEIRVDYYAQSAPLVNGSDTNTLSTIAWDLIVYAALTSAAEWFTDKRVTTFEARYQQILSDIQMMADEGELDTAVMQPCLIFPDEDGYTGWGYY